MAFDSFDQLTDRAEDRALAIDFAGLTLPWLVDGLAIERASRRGVELGATIADLQRLQPEGVDPSALQAMSEDEQQEALKQFAEEGGADMDRVQQAITAVADLLFIGFCRFEPALEREQVLAHVSLEAIATFPLGQMVDHMTGSDDPDAPDAGK